MAKKRIKTGQMRERVTFLSVADAPFGAHSLKRTLTEVTTRWAEVREYSVAQRAGRGLAETITHQFRTREGADLDGVDNTYLIRWRGKLYKVAFRNIVGGSTDDPRKQFVGFDVEYQGTEDAYKDPSPENE